MLPGDSSGLDERRIKTPSVVEAFFLAQNPVFGTGTIEEQGNI
jgi:hypothetical protein